MCVHPLACSFLNPCCLSPQNSVLTNPGHTGNEKPTCLLKTCLYDFTVFVSVCEQLTTAEPLHMAFLYSIVFIPEDEMKDKPRRTTCAGCYECRSKDSR